MTEELVMRLRRRDAFVFDPVSLKPRLHNPDGPEAAEAIEGLQAEVERLTYDGIHTCHDDCPRLPCVQRREIDALQADVAELESWKVAEEAHHHLLLAEVRRLTNELSDRKADVRHLTNELQAHKDALAQVKGWGDSGVASKP
jgi:hypothetical protein